MNGLILLGGFLVVFGIGTGISIFLANLRNKAVQGTLTEKNKQLNLQLENNRQQFLQQISDLKQQALESRNAVEKQLAEACREREEIRREKDFLRDELTRKSSEYEHLSQRNSEQKEEVEKLQEKFSKEFENLANRILEQKSEKFTVLNKDNIQNILNPLNDKIKSFEEKIEKNSNDFIERHAQLGKQLQYLNEQNIKISEEATNLTRALKGDTKMQGNWGEMLLESVLEKSGLQKDREYFVQQSFTTEEGRRVLPDVVIHLPGDKKMIVDSKVSLNAYERFINGSEETEKNIHLKDHVNSVKKRVEELSAENYHRLYEMESPDFVLLFIPIEAAFAVASSEYPNLYTRAFEKNIIIVTPTTLLAVLKTIDSMWQNEKQKQNAIDIATQAGALYDSFTGLTDELLKLGRQMGTVQNSYETAMKKLTGKGNLIRRVERLKTLGAKASKHLDQKLLAKASAEEEEEEALDLS